MWQTKNEPEKSHMQLKQDFPCETVGRTQTGLRNAVTQLRFLQNWWSNTSNFYSVWTEIFTDYTSPEPCF